MKRRPKTIRQPSFAGIWGSAYNIDCCKGTWTATCKGDTYVMSATSPDDLRSRIWDDYSRRKIPGAIGDA